MSAKVSKIAENDGATDKLYRSLRQTTAYSIKKGAKWYISTILHLFKAFVIISSPFSYDTP